MATIYEEIREVKEVVIKKVVGKVCDWCKQDVPEPVNCDDDRPSIDVDIEVMIVRSCGDTDFVANWRVDDLCLACAEKLENTLENLGVTIMKDEYDW